MIKNKAPVYCFISATALINITDNPKLEAVYKMAELQHTDGIIEQKAKLTKGKESYPGRKQVFRVYENGLMKEDIIGLETEKLGEPLLHKIIETGKLTISIPNLDDISEHLNKELISLPERYKDVSQSAPYEVSPSGELLKLLEQVKKIHT
jgi:nicotinate phosphoribosyltransferase